MSHGIFIFSRKMDFSVPKLALSGENNLDVEKI
jgi:hypothetical protein